MIVNWSQIKIAYSSKHFLSTSFYFIRWIDDAELWQFKIQLRRSGKESQKSAKGHPKATMQGECFASHIRFKSLSASLEIFMQFAPNLLISWCFEPFLIKIWPGIVSFLQIWNDLRIQEDFSIKIIGRLYQGFGSISIFGHEIWLQKHFGTQTRWNVRIDISTPTHQK